MSDEYDEIPWRPWPEDAARPDALRSLQELLAMRARDIAALADRDVRRLMADYIRHPSDETGDTVRDTIDTYLDALNARDLRGECDECALWLYAALIILDHHRCGYGTLSRALRRYSDGTI